MRLHGHALTRLTGSNRFKHVILITLSPVKYQEPPMDQVSSFFENMLVVEPLLGKSQTALEDDTEQLDPESPSPVPKESSSYDLSSFLWSNNSNVAAEPLEPGKTDTSSQVGRKGSAAASGAVPTTGTLLLMEKMISMILPMNATTEEGQSVLKERIEMQKSRPSLSVNIMSKNLINLIQRLLVPFQFLDQVIVFFLWGKPTFTLAVLLAFTHVVLNPALATSLPFAYTIVAVLVPHYLDIYPPDRLLTLLNGAIKNEYWKYNPIPAETPLRPAQIPGPVPELSREFLLNLTDLQNHMVLYVVAYDFVIWATRDLLYFKDENVSGLVLIVCALAMIYNFYFAPRLFWLMWSYLPIKLTVLTTVWGFLVAMHPILRNRLLEWLFQEDTRLQWVTLSNRIEEILGNRLFGDSNLEKDAKSTVGAGSSTEETREVEIFELHSLNHKTRVWEPLGFCNQCFTINDPNRINILLAAVESQESKEDSKTMLSVDFPDIVQTESDSSSTSLESTSRDRRRSMASTASTEDEKLTPVNDFKVPTLPDLDSIRPPMDWAFLEADWCIDLDVTSWVVSELMADVVFVDDDEKWVYDVLSDLIDDDKKHQGEPVYRRRRWIRRCCRSRVQETQKNNTNTPQRQSQSFTDYFM